MVSRSIASVPAVSDAGYLDITADRSLLDHFMRLYLPSAAADRTGATLTWLKEAFESPQPSLVLELARHALAANRVAAVDGNSPKKHTGHIYYGRALQALNERLSKHLDEPDNQIFESTAASVSSWASHQRGLVELVMKRGMANFQDDTSKALLLDIRGTDLITSAQYSRSSPLASGEWQLGAAPTSLREVEHRFCDLGLELSGLFEEDDALASSSEPTLEQNENLVVEIDRRRSDLEILFQQMEQFRPASTTWRAEQNFWNLETALYTANIKVMMLDASITIREITARCDRVASRSHPASSIVTAVTGQYTTEAEAVLTSQILSALEYTTRDDMGLYGAQKSLFAIRMMLCNLSRQNPLFDRSLALINRLAQRGLRHVQDLDNEWGQPGTLDRNQNPP